MFHVWLHKRKFEQINKNVFSTFHRNGSKKSSHTHLCSLHNSFASSAEAEQRTAQNFAAHISHGFCLFLYSASSTRINFEPQNWGRTFSVKLLINIEKVHRSCKVLKAGGDCQHQYLMQHKSEGICHIRLSIPFLFTGTVGLLSDHGAVHSNAIIIPPRANIFRPRYKFQPQNECFSVTEAGQISIIMLWYGKKLSSGPWPAIFSQLQQRSAKNTALN